MQAETLSGGFAAPPVQSAHAFRSIMEAMARPGTLQEVSGATPPAPLSPAAGAVLLMLCDADTPVHLAGEADCPEVKAWLSFHTGAPLSGPKECLFALGTWEALQPISSYPIGTSQFPDRSATLIVEMLSLTNTGATLRGPGIQDTAMLSLPETKAFEANRALFPQGLDFLFTCRSQVAALPRTTEVR